MGAKHQGNVQGTKCCIFLQTMGWQKQKENRQGAAGAGLG